MVELSAITQPAPFGSCVGHLRTVMIASVDSVMFPVPLLIMLMFASLEPVWLRKPSFGAMMGARSPFCRSSALIVALVVFEPHTLPPAWATTLSTTESGCPPSVPMNLRVPLNCLASPGLSCTGSTSSGVNTMLVVPEDRPLTFSAALPPFLRVTEILALLFTRARG
ncbi:Uncharacterised protein [uncultured archaeon]|nr:Uncharacterised protein [uncultured archaeon]